ncbi:DUF6236 family protein [Achromobacter sp.]|uniref:DUF6236 family protein n=1 Tax=Achromobacter sp. TaxID=134375 RepID=UPI003CFD3F58
MLLPDLYQDNKSGLKVTESGIEGPTIEIPSVWRPEQLRFGLCFWDRIAWPSLNILPSPESAEMDFLNSAGVLVRPEATLVPNLASPGRGFAETYFNAYQNLEKNEPGRWSLSATAEYDLKLFLGDHITKDRGITVSLHRAIPIPTRDVALHDLLEFKQKRDPELLALRAELDGYKQLITSATDRAEAFATQKDLIDEACKNILRVSREHRMPIHISDMSFGIELNRSAIIAVAAAAAALPDKTSLTGVEAFLASVGVIATSSIKWTAAFGISNKMKAKRQSPFRYVHHLHEELDWL